MAILGEIISETGGVAGEARLNKNAIYNYMGVIRFNNSKLAGAKVINMQNYGWEGTVQTNYQDLEVELEKQIPKSKNVDNGKFKCIVIFSHGRENEYSYVINNIKQSFSSSSIFTNHLEKTTLSGLNYHFLNRLENEIPNEIEVQKKEYERNKKKLEFEKHALEVLIAVRTNNGDKDYDGRAEIFRKIEELKDEIKKITREFHSFEDDLLYEMKLIRQNHYSGRTRQDILSLGRIIAMVADGGYLVFAACHSGHGLGGSSQASHPLLKAIHNYYKVKINIVGIEFKARFTSVDNTNGSIDGNILIRQEGGMQLISFTKNSNNKAVKLSPTGEISTCKNLKIVTNELKWG